MTNNKRLHKTTTITSVTFLSAILLTSTILMTMPTADAYEPQPQMWFSSKNSKEVGTFLASETYEGYAWEGSVNVIIYANYLQKLEPFQMRLLVSNDNQISPKPSKSYFLIILTRDFF